MNSLTIPVTADVESGYATKNAELKENIKMLLDTGIAGINFEDTNKEDKIIISIEAQCEKLRLIRNTASEMGVLFFINARTDIYIKANNLSDEEKLSETRRRGKAYKIQERIVSIPSH
jgi:2-methylisocitrate lyase-like PEP mutase family enzyme